MGKKVNRPGGLKERINLTVKQSDAFCNKTPVADSIKTKRRLLLRNSLPGCNAFIEDFKSKIVITASAPGHHQFSQI